MKFYTEIIEDVELVGCLASVDDEICENTEQEDHQDGEKTEDEDEVMMDPAGPASRLTGLHIHLTARNNNRHHRSSSVGGGRGGDGHHGGGGGGWRWL